MEALPENANMGFHDIRSLAMSTSPEAAELGRRFMFIALFCFASGVAILILTVSYTLIEGTLERLFFLIIWLLFYMRGLDFEYRALNTPFSVALAQLLLSSKEASSDGANKT